MLFSISVKLNRGDWTPYASKFVTFFPSTLAFRCTTESWISLAHCLNCFSLFKFGNVAKLHSVFNMGNRMELSDDTVHCLITSFPKEPGMNHTGPFWFTVQYLPVSSYAGWISFGME